MDQQSLFQQSQQEITKQFAQLSLSETDDEQLRSGTSSPLLYGAGFKDILRKLPEKVRQQFDNSVPLSKMTYEPCMYFKPDESIFIGQEKNTFKEGYGFQIWEKSGNLLEGFWQEDVLEGYCRMIYGNGDIFECEFHQGKTQGFGIFKSQKKIVKGIWVDNTLQGEGQEFKNDGTRYYGQFKNGKKNGKCLIFYKDGCKYEGEIVNNNINGSGVFYWTDNSYYQGQFQNGIIQGYGTYVQSNQFMNGYFNEIRQQQNDNIQLENINKQSETQKIIFVNQFNQQFIIEKIRLF